jgi:hypothetical protein
MIELSDSSALVTGASAGIGREIARVLAREVKALVLVARRRDRLDELAKELTAARPSLTVHVRAVDLLNRDETAAVLDALDRDGIAIDVFVNNAGFGDFGLFEDEDWPKLERMLELNVVTATFLLRRLVTPMIARRRGAILNLGSLAGVVPSPMMGAYAATKAYVNHLSEGLAMELAPHGISVTVVCPGPVPTEFQEVAGTGHRPSLPAFMHVDAVQVAEEAVSAMRRGKARVFPGNAVAAMALALESMPKAAVRPFLRNMIGKMRGQP